MKPAHSGDDALVPPKPLDAPLKKVEMFRATIDTSGTLRLMGDPPKRAKFIPTCQEGMSNSGVAGAHGLHPPPLPPHAVSEFHVPSVLVVNNVPPTETMCGSSLGGKSPVPFVSLYEPVSPEEAKSACPWVTSCER